MAKKPTDPKSDQTVSQAMADPEQHPQSNLMLADIAMRMGTSVLRKGVESMFLRGQYGKDTAKALVKERSLRRTVASTVIAKVGTKSIPGAAIVGGGLVIKTLFDRSKGRQTARKRAKMKALNNPGEE